VVIKILIVALGYEEWLFIIMKVEAWHVLASVPDDLIIVGPIIRLWFVVHFWELHENKSTNYRL
jgi:hypothetical protein